MICSMRVNAAVLTVYRDIFAGGEKNFFDHFFARPGSGAGFPLIFMEKFFFSKTVKI